MFLSRNKKVDVFSELLSKSLLQTELGNFDDALKNYATLRDLAVQDKKEQDRKFVIYSNIMRLYLKTVEIRNYYLHNNFDDLKDALEYMVVLIADTKAASLRYLASIDFFEKHLQEYSRLYMYHFYWTQMVTKLKHIYSLLAIGVGDSAKIKYEQLLKIYNKLVDYSTQNQRDRIYVQLLKLKEEINLITLKEQAYSKYARVDVSTKKFRKPLVYVQQREFLGSDTYYFDDKFSKMHKYLKRNNLDGAQRLYEQI